MPVLRGSWRLCSEPSNHRTQCVNGLGKCSSRLCFRIASRRSSSRGDLRRLCRALWELPRALAAVLEPSDEIAGVTPDAIEIIRVSRRTGAGSSNRKLRIHKGARQPICRSLLKALGVRVSPLRRRLAYRWLEPLIVARIEFLEWTLTIGCVRPALRRYPQRQGHLGYSSRMIDTH